MKGGAACREAVSWDEERGACKEGGQLNRRGDHAGRLLVELKGAACKGSRQLNGREEAMQAGRQLN